jgi:hypothetical protein
MHHVKRVNVVHKTGTRRALGAGLDFLFLLELAEEQEELLVAPSVYELVTAAAVVLIEFAVEGLAADAQRFGGVSLVAVGVVECCFNCLALDLVHR